MLGHFSHLSYFELGEQNEEALGACHLPDLAALFDEGLSPGRLLANQALVSAAARCVALGALCTQLLIGIVGLWPMFVR